MKKKLIKRGIAIVTSFCMLLTILPIGVLAADESENSTWEKAYSMIMTPSYYTAQNMVKPHETIVKGLSGDLVFELGTSLFAGEFSPLNDSSKFYQIVLLDMIQNKNQIDDTISAANEILDSTEIETYQFIISRTSDAIEATDAINKVDEGIWKEVFKGLDLGSDSVDILMTSGKAIGTFVEELSTLYTLQAISEQTILALDKIGGYASRDGNEDLYNAVLQVKEKVRVASQEQFNAFLYSADKTLEELWKDTTSGVVTAAMTALGLGPLVIGWVTGNLLANIIAGSDGLSKDYKILKCICVLDEYLKESLDSREDSILKGKADEAAQIIAEFYLYKNLQLFSLDIMDDWFNILESKQEAWYNQVLIWMGIMHTTDEDTLKEWREIINNLRDFFKTTDFFLGSGDAEVGAVDLCFVIDTTGSMGDDIADVKENMSSIYNALRMKSDDFRIALVDYRDYSERTGDDDDYPARLQMDFTNDTDEIQSVIDGLGLGNGGDEEETIYSALVMAANLEWRADAEQIVLLMGDAGPLDPEPISGYTYDDVLKALEGKEISSDIEEFPMAKAAPAAVREAEVATKDISVFTVPTSGGAPEFFKQISDDTSGYAASIGDSVDSVSEAIINAIGYIGTIDLNPYNLVTPVSDISVIFPADLANQEIQVFYGKDWLFTRQTDETATITFTNILPGEYRWIAGDRNGIFEIGAGGSVTVQETLIGDVNADGTVNNRDTSHLARYLSGKEELNQLQLLASDVNGDGNINNRDVAKLARYLSGKESLSA